MFKSTIKSIVTIALLLLVLIVISYFKNTHTPKITVNDQTVATSSYSYNVSSIQPEDIQIQNEKIEKYGDEHIRIDNTLRDVDFCGIKYKVRQIFIDGIDVVQRVAEIANKKYYNEHSKLSSEVLESEDQFYYDFEVQVCNNVFISTVHRGQNVNDKLEIDTNGYDPNFFGPMYSKDGKYVKYFIALGPEAFSVNLPGYEIFSYSMFDGSPIYYGSLK